jgi:hypothetical protein
MKIYTVTFHDEGEGEFHTLPQGSQTFEGAQKIANEDFAANYGTEDGPLLWIVHRGSFPVCTGIVAEYTINEVEIV